MTESIALERQGEDAGGASQMTNVARLVELSFQTGELLGQTADGSEEWLLGVARRFDRKRRVECAKLMFTDKHGVTPCYFRNSPNRLFRCEKR
jgi:hypothetical protein